MIVLGVLCLVLGTAESEPELGFVRFGIGMPLGYVLISSHGSGMWLLRRYFSTTIVNHPLRHRTVPVTPIFPIFAILYNLQ